MSRMELHGGVRRARRRWFEPSSAGKELAYISSCCVLSAVFGNLNRLSVFCLQMQEQEHQRSW